MQHGLLAEHPAWFADTGRVRRKPDPMDMPPHSMTNQGLQIQLPVMELKDGGYVGVLDCAQIDQLQQEYKHKREPKSYTGVYLRRQQGGRNHFKRVLCDQMCSVDDEYVAKCTTETICVVQGSEESGAKEVIVRVRLKVSNGGPKLSLFSRSVVVGISQNDSKLMLVGAAEELPAACTIDEELYRGMSRLVLLGKWGDHNLLFVFGALSSFLGYHAVWLGPHRSPFRPEPCEIDLREVRERIKLSPFRSSRERLGPFAVTGSVVSVEHRKPRDGYDYGILSESHYTVDLNFKCLPYWYPPRESGVNSAMSQTSLLRRSRAHLNLRARMLEDAATPQPSKQNEMPAYLTPSPANYETSRLGVLSSKIEHRSPSPGAMSPRLGVIPETDPDERRRATVHGA